MEQKIPKKQSQLNSFAVAFNGLKILLLHERNFRIHIVFTIITIAACGIFKVTAGEWIAVLILIALVLSLEAINTCIESICDYITPDYHHLIKKIKDISAAAVLISAIIAVIVGCIIFIPYILMLI